MKDGALKLSTYGPSDSYAGYYTMKNATEYDLEKAKEAIAEVSMSMDPYARDRRVGDRLKKLGFEKYGR